MPPSSDGQGPGGPQNPYAYPGQQPGAAGPTPQPGYGYGQQPAAPGYPEPQMPGGYPPPAPQQQAGSYGAQPQQHDPGRYDFFLESQQKTPRGRAGGTPMPPIMKIALAAGGFVAILIIAAVFLAMSSSKQKAAPTGLTSIAAEQQELLRVTALGVQNVQSQSLKNFNSTAAPSLTTAQKDIMDYAGKHGASVDKKLLGAAKDSRTDQVLSAAQSAGTYDSAYKSAMDQLLNDYAVKVQQVHDTATQSATRDLLDSDLHGAQLLKQMLDQ